MATVIKQLAQFANETVTVNLEYESTNLRCGGVRVINGGAENVYVAIIRDVDQRLYENIFPPGTTYVPFPTTGGGRLTLANVERKLWGINIAMKYPA